MKEITSMKMKAVKQIQFFAQYNLIIANPNFNLGKKKNTLLIIISSQTCFSKGKDRALLKFSTLKNKKKRHMRCGIIL